MFKKLILGLVVLIVLIGAGGYYLFMNLDGLIKRAVEQYGSAATQASVTLDSVKLALTTGQGELSGLSIGNPKGFSTPKAFYLGNIAVKVNTASIQGTGPIVIDSITIDKPQVTYELLNSGTSNLQAIQNNAQAYAKSLQGSGEAAKAVPANSATANGGVSPANGGTSRKLIISSLTVSGGQISISQEMLKGKQLDAPLPTIHLTNIGKDSGGATAGQVAEQLLNAISQSAAQASVTELAKAKIGGLINQVPTGAIGGAAGDTINGAVKGLFGN